MDPSECACSTLFGLLFSGSLQVPRGLGLRHWGDLLIERVGLPGWALINESVGTVQNIVIRRQQMGNVHSYVTDSREWHAIAPE